MGARQDGDGSLKALVDRAQSVDQGDILPLDRNNKKETQTQTLDGIPPRGNEPLKPKEVVGTFSLISLMVESDPNLR